MSFVWKELLPVQFAKYTTAERDALTDVPGNIVLQNTTTGRLTILSVGEQWMEFLHYYGTATSEEIVVWNATEGYWEPKSPSEYLAMLSGAAAAAFSFGAQDIYTSGMIAAGQNSAADASAVLEAESTTKGFLPPRMTTAQRNAISNPAVGLAVYDTNKKRIYINVV